MPISVVFENPHFVIINKAAGVLSVPSSMGMTDPRPFAGLQVQEKFGKKIFPVHRLDEEVSGLLMFALTSEAHRSANLWFEDHQVIKTYEALSPPPAPEDKSKLSVLVLWECKLMRGKKRAYEAEFGKKSVTKAKLVGHTNNGRAVWHLQPLTGRSHQLRYEMARHGFPIDGDKLYGSTVLDDASIGIKLRAAKLDFTSCKNYKHYDLPAIISLETVVPLENF